MDLEAIAQETDGGAYGRRELIFGVGPAQLVGGSLLNETIRKTVRTLMVWFPGLAGVKHRTVNAIRRITGKVGEPDFDVCRWLENDDQHQFVDIGANRGQSIDALLMTTDKGQIYAFEANGVLATHLERRYRHLSRVVVHAVALGDRATETTLFVPHYRSWRFDGLASLNYEAARLSVQDRVFFYRQRLMTVREVPCTVKRLDEFCLAPTFMKLDVEGGEFAVLRGAEQTLAGYLPLLLIESPEPAVIEYLRRFGYGPHAYRGQRLYAGERGRPNTYFLTEAWRCRLGKLLAS